MKDHSKEIGLILGITLLSLSGCSLPLSQEVQRGANRDLSFMKVTDDPSAYVGETVIWAGVILQVQNKSEGAEIRVRQNRLKTSGYPDAQVSDGEFIALTDEPLDLHIFREGKKITMGGEIVGEKTEEIQSIKFRYPVIHLKEFYLWGNGGRWWEPGPSSAWFWNILGSDRNSEDPTVKVWQ